MIIFPQYIWNIIISYLIYDYRYVDKILFQQRKDSSKFIDYNKQIDWALWWRRTCIYNRRQDFIQICSNTLYHLYKENQNNILKLELKHKRNSYLQIYKIPSCNESMNGMTCDNHCHILCNGNCAHLCNHICKSKCHYHCNNHPNKIYKCNKKCHHSFEVIKLICQKCLLDKNSKYKVCSCNKKMEVK